MAPPGSLTKGTIQSKKKNLFGGSKPRSAQSLSFLYLSEQLWKNSFSPLEKLKILSYFVSLPKLVTLRFNLRTNREETFLGEASYWSATQSIRAATQSRQRDERHLYCYKQTGYNVTRHGYIQHHGWLERRQSDSSSSNVIFLTLIRTLGLWLPDKSSFSTSNFVICFDILFLKSANKKLFKHSQS